MADIVDSATRSRMMSGIRGKNTKPEIIIRKLLFNAGFRYRLHVKDLPGKPDIVLPKYHAVIFIHGCFWHGHDCPLFKMPSTRGEFWKSKIARTKKLDAEAQAKLADIGWRVGAVWECALKGVGRHHQEDLLEEISGWLQGNEGKLEITGTKAWRPKTREA